jgi:hypothetical protein
VLEEERKMDAAKITTDQFAGIKKALGLDEKMVWDDSKGRKTGAIERRELVGSKIDQATWTKIDRMQNIILCGKTSCYGPEINVKSPSYKVTLTPVQQVMLKQAFKDKSQINITFEATYNSDVHGKDLRLVIIADGEIVNNQEGFFTGVSPAKILNGWIDSFIESKQGK